MLNRGEDIWGKYVLVYRGIKMLYDVKSEIGAIVAIAGFVALLGPNNRWHDSELFLDLERKVDSAFYRLCCTNKS